MTLSATTTGSDNFGSWGGPCVSAAAVSTCAVAVTASGSATVTFTAPPTKPVLTGLVTMGDQSWVNNPTDNPQNRLLEANVHPGVYVAAVIEATWLQLEPQPDVFDDSVIDAALQAIKAYNATYPATLIVGKLRIFAGVHSPAWVLQQIGSVSITDSNTGAMVTVPEFWTGAYSQLWTQLQDHLAGAYDSNPLMGAVAISVCSSLTAEPFVVPNSIVPALTAAGHTAAQMQQRLSNAVDDYSAWKLTPLDYTLNTTFDGSSAGGYPVLDPGGGGVPAGARHARRRGRSRPRRSDHHDGYEALWRIPGAVCRGAGRDAARCFTARVSDPRVRPLTGVQ